MREQDTPPDGAAQRDAVDAIDINDFVYAATGARVRRLTTPDGEHWFPAVDVCAELGHSNSRKALKDHVPPGGSEVLETVTKRYGLAVPAGREWRRDLRVVNLHGLIRLVNACTLKGAEPFKKWITDVIVQVQQDGSYGLRAIDVPPGDDNRGTGYVLPDPVLAVIIRLEERNMRLDEEAAAARRAELSLHGETLAAIREATDVQAASARSMASIAESMERLVGHITSADKPPLSSSPDPSRQDPSPGEPLTAKTVLAAWRARLVITDDVWAVAVCIVPGLVECGEVRQSPESIASRTGLTVSRVRDCLRFLQKRQCVRQVGATRDGSPVYVLRHP